MSTTAKLCRSRWDHISPGGHTDFPIYGYEDWTESLCLPYDGAQTSTESLLATMFTTRCLSQGGGRGKGEGEQGASEHSTTVERPTVGA